MRFPYLFFAPLLLVGTSSAQENMLAGGLNFKYVASAPKQIVSEELLNSTPSELQQHPEFGRLPYNAPCDNCFEVLEKRTENSRYFLKEGSSGSYFFNQTGYEELHFKKGDIWHTLDYRLRRSSVDSHLYHAPDQPIPTSINLKKKETSISAGASLSFNKNLQLAVLQDGEITVLHSASWEQNSIGEDGVFVQNVFPGIDMTIQVKKASIKTAFIINDKSALTFLQENQTLVVIDQIACTANAEWSTANAVNMGNNRFSGDLKLNATNGQGSFTIHEAVIFDQAGDAVNGVYHLTEGELHIEVDGDWLLNQNRSFPVTIDPLVTGTSTQVQSGITGSMYNASCNFDNGCAYSINLVVPSGAEVTDIKWSFGYETASVCLLNDGALDFTYAGCRAPTAGSFYRCNTAGPGNCIANNVSVLSFFSSCLPAPQCGAYIMPVTMNFYRRCAGLSGCDGNCIAAATDWTLTVEGRTVEQSTTPSSSDGTDICLGGTTQLSATGNYGVSPYTYSWLPGNQNTQSILVSPTGNTAYVCTITDACGNTATNSINITVNTNNSLAAPVLASSMSPASGNPCPVTVTYSNPSGSSYAGGPESYRWSFSNASSITPSTLTGTSNAPPYGGPYVVVYNTGGTFTTTLTIISGGACGQSTQTVAICTLPLELLEFKGKSDGESVLLEWISASEMNSGTYFLERSSEAQEFLLMGEIPSNDKSNNRYSFRDKTPNPGINYYRLRKVDKDGGANFSDILSIEFNVDNQLEFYPNPAEEYGNLRFESAGAGMGTLYIYNLLGKEILRKDIAAIAGNNEVRVDLREIQAGSYMILLQEGNRFQKTPIIIR